MILGLSSSSSIEMVRAATNKLSKEDLIATLSKSKLNDEMKEQILAERGLIGEELEAAMATATHSSSNVGAAATTDLFAGSVERLKLAAKGLGEVLLANPILLAATAVAAVAVAGSLALKFYRDYQESRQKDLQNTISSANESIQKYEDEKSSLISLQDKLNDAKGDKTKLLAIQSELNNAIGETPGLIDNEGDSYEIANEKIKLRIKFLDDLIEKENEAKIAAQREIFKTNTTPYEFGVDDFKAVGLDVDIKEASEQLKRFQEEKKKLLDMGVDEDSYSIKVYDEKIARYKEILQEKVNEAKDVFSEYINSSFEDDESKLYINKYIEELIFGGEDDLDVIKNKITSLKPSINEFSKLKNELLENTYAGKETDGLKNKIKDLIETIREDAPEAADLMASSLNYIANAARNTSNSIKELDSNISALSKIDSLSNGLDQLDKIYADIYNKKDFDYSSVLNNKEFTETFQGLDSYEKFIETIVNSPNDIAACQEAFNLLTTEYIENSGALDNVTESNKKATIAMLEQMGVTNASKIVEDKLNEKITLTKAQYDRLNETLGKTVEATKLSSDAYRIERNALELLGVSVIDAKQIVAISQADMTNYTIQGAKDRIAALKAEAEAYSKWYSARLNSGDTPGEISKTLGTGTEADSDYESYLQYARFKNELSKLETSLPKVQYGGGTKTASEKEKTEKSTEKESEPKTIDWIETSINRIERAIKKLEKTAKSTYKSLKTRLSATSKEISTINKEIEIQQKAYDKYTKKANSVNISDDLKKKVQDGTIAIEEYDSETAELIQEYQNWYEKSLDCADAIDELHDSLTSLYEDKFDYIEKDYENQIKMMEHLSNTYDTGLNELEAKGYLENSVYYAAKQGVEMQKLASLNMELASLSAAFGEAMASGEIEAGSEAWYEYQIALNNVKEEIQETEVTLLELEKTMREVEWGHFDYLQEQISQLTSEANFLIDLLDSDKLYDDKGNITNDGMATMGLHAMNYNVYMAQADKYAKEMMNIEKEMALNPYNKDLIARKQELLSLQQESILAAEDEKQAVIDMVSEGIEYELSAMKELINTYTEALDNAKDLYDYQNKVSEQTQKISSIEKQLSAYKNDNSEETRATVQKLKVDLEKARKDLEETEYDKYVSDQKKLLDSLYSEYESLLNQRLDNVDALISEAIDSVNTNADSINQTLIDAGNEVGYTLTDSMQTIWSSATSSITGVVSMYGDGFNDKLTSINLVLNSIQAGVQAMVAVSAMESMAKVATSTVENIISSVPNNSSSSSSGNTSNKNNGTANKTTEKNTETSKPITVGGKVKASSSALIYDYPGEKGEKQYYANDPNYIVLKEQNGYVQVRYHKLSKGVTGWLKKSDVKAYKRGGIVDFTGMAWLDGTPSKPEMVLNSKDTENFIALKDVLKKMSEQEISMSGDYRYKGLNSSISSTMLSDVTKKVSELRDNTISQNQSVVFGDTNISIDHVQNYEDFVTQLQKDDKFERLIRSMTIDRLNGGSSLAKNKYRW